MIGIGTLIDAAAVVLGGGIGILIRNYLPKRFETLFFQTVGIFVICVGISMTGKMENMLFIIASLVAGATIGTILEIEKNTLRFGDWIKNKLNSNGDFAEGLSTAFLLFAVGAMSVLGAIEEGTGAKPELLYTKAFLDGVSAIILAAVFGYGVLFSAILLIVFQLSITYLTLFLGDFINQEMLTGITEVGGILLLGLGLKVLDIKKLPVLNMIPAIFIIAITLWVKTNCF